MDIFDAVRKNDIIRVRELLDSGVNPNTKNLMGFTSLMYASLDGHTDIVKLLLERGADPNIKHRFYGHTALMKATENSHIDIIRILLEKGANPNIRNELGYTPLISASREGHIEIVRLLLENGADPNIKNNWGETPLMMASISGHSDIVRLLLERGADPNIKHRYGFTAYDKTRYRDIKNLIQEHMDLQRMQRPLQNLAFMKYFLDNDDLDIDTASKIFSNVYSYNPSVHTRMMLEDKQKGSGKHGKKRSKKHSKKRSKKHSKKRSKKHSKKRSGKKKSKTKKKY